jgi:hypothetical protein
MSLLHLGDFFNVRAYPVKKLIGLAFEGVSPKTGIKNWHRNFASFLIVLL